jgi:transcriptional regulator with XRE-family HTH domain
VEIAVNKGVNIIREEKQMNAFAKKFRQIRVEQEITLREISKETGKSIAYLSDVEHGRRMPPSADVVKGIEKALGIKDRMLQQLANSVREAPKDFTNLMRNNPAVATLAHSLMRIENELEESQVQDLISKMQATIDSKED